MEKTNESKEVQKYIPPPDNYDFPVLDDVYGTDQLKESLEEILFNVENPMLFQAFGIDSYKSFMFNGNPGTGKTFSYKAIRNEAAQKEVPVVHLPYDIGNYGTAYINQGAKILQEFFNMGHKISNEGGVVMYWFDEADVLMGKRGTSENHKEDDKLLDCLMKNLQEINSYIDNEYVFFATNFYDAMDNAATRSGRIDKIVTFDLPDLEARKQYFKGCVESMNNKMCEIYDNNIKLFKRVNYSRLAEMTDGYNYADIKGVLDSTVRSHVKESYRLKDLDRKVSEKDILTVLDSYKQEKVKPKIGFI